MNPARCTSKHQIWYKFGIKVPHTYAEALKFSQENNNSLWHDATALELQQLHDYNTFCNLGKDTLPPSDYTKVSVCLAFDAKEDGHC